MNPWLRLKTLYTQKHLPPSAFRFPRQPACSLSSERDCLPFFPPPRRPTAVKCRAWALISFQFCLLVLHSQRFFGFSFERSRLESPRKRHPISGIVHSLSVSRSIRTLLPSFSNPPPSLFFRRFSPRENPTRRRIRFTSGQSVFSRPCGIIYVTANLGSWRAWHEPRSPNEFREGCTPFVRTSSVLPISGLISPSYRSPLILH